MIAVEDFMPRKTNVASPSKPSQTSTQTPITPRLVTIKQAAGLLFVFGVGDSTGHLVEGVACLRIGNHFLIDRGDLDSFIDARLRERAP